VTVPVEPRRPQLIVALRRQEFTGGDVNIAEALATAGTLVEFKSGENITVSLPRLELIAQGWELPPPARNRRGDGYFELKTPYGQLRRCLS
jgi:hypothetical protein